MFPLTTAIPIRFYQEDLAAIKECSGHELLRGDAAAIRWMVHQAVPLLRKQFGNGNGKAKAAA